MSDKFLKTTKLAWTAESFWHDYVLYTLIQFAVRIRERASQMLRECSLVLVCSLPAPVMASTIDLTETKLASGVVGPPIHQQFLESGASFVRTMDSTYCVVSRRIDIAASEYRDADGTAVPFDEVIRSPATSIQVMDAPDGSLHLRVQMKYSPDPAVGIILTIGSEKLYVTEFLEPSTDSLRFKEALAARLVAAFRNGLRVQLVAHSRATGRAIKDVLEAPDMAALDACRSQMAVKTATALPPLVRQLSVDFDVSSDPASLATLEDYRACGMTATDAPLHVGRIRATTGFFSHTDKIFVSFDKYGGLDRIYVPGLLDAGFAGATTGVASVSRSADQNLPNEENAVTGCIGSSAMAICNVSTGEGSGHRLQACAALPGNDDFVGPGVNGAILTEPAEIVSVLTPAADGDIYSPDAVLFDDFKSLDSIPDFFVHPTQPAQIVPPPPSPVPLPSAFWFMIVGLAGFATPRLRTR